jgi:hypothetical protein
MHGCAVRGAIALQRPEGRLAFRELAGPRVGLGTPHKARARGRGAARRPGLQPECTRPARWVAGRRPRSGAARWVHGHL